LAGTARSGCSFSLCPLWALPIPFQPAAGKPRQPPGLPAVINGAAARPQHICCSFATRARNVSPCGNLCIGRGRHAHGQARYAAPVVAARTPFPSLATIPGSPPLPGFLFICGHGRQLADRHRR
jgi:hypothetical protein